MINKTSKSINHTAINFGNMDDLMQHTIASPIGEIKGKVFLKDSTNATGMEISFQMLPPKTQIPYFHSHKQNEEMYIIIKGNGKFQVDDECFDVSEGSAIRVATSGKRCLNNTSDENMVYMVIQVKEKSLEQCSLDDGKIEKQQALWS